MTGSEPDQLLLAGPVGDAAAGGDGTGVQIGADIGGKRRRGVFQADGRRPQHPAGHGEGKIGILRAKTSLRGDRRRERLPFSPHRCRGRSRRPFR